MATAPLTTADPALEAEFFWAKHRTAVALGLLVVLAALVGFGVYQYYAQRQKDAAAALLAEAKSEPDFRKVIADYPGSPAAADAYLLLAEKQRSEGKKFIDANSTLQSFVDKYPQHELVTTARMGMAANLESLGKKDEALSAYQRLVASYPKSFNAPLALLSQVHLLREQGKIDDARRACETIMTQYRDSYISGEAARVLRMLRPAEKTRAAALAPGQTPVAPAQIGPPPKAFVPTKPAASPQGSVKN